ncbi:Qat anti-phage system ATPase QatA [Thiosulfatihalobacter marinus]|uniref:Qat anti-phage system ATPase QatA n=1 Tax=Thiosulfatihalobacter marinus TaxID=2792481 RepID=UPI0018D60B89|nr:Qat anti-phage system ATPase QatA [Thiosulfatihalobacter marinus]
MIIPDNETAVDMIYSEAVSATVAKVIRDSGTEPLTVGVHGDWGAGKSSVLLMLEEAFSEDDRTSVVRFNGWLFQGLEDAKTVIIETIVEQLLRDRALTTKLKDASKKLLKRVDLMKVASKAGGLALTGLTGIPSPDMLGGLMEQGKKLLADGSEITVGDMTGYVKNVMDCLNDPDAETLPAHIHAFRSEFEELLTAADIDRLVVVVDDLDRCLPATAIETLEAIRLFLFVPGAAFVIAADEGMIEYAVRSHFPDLPLSSGPSTYARNYLEKLIQVPFRLPPLGYVETKIYLTLLVAGSSLDAGSPSFEALLDLGREALRRPWDGNGLSRGAIEERLGTVSPELENALILADQLALPLAEGAQGNPRQIKRFLNTLNLRLAIADARRIGEDVNPAVLAKLMLAERFKADFFEGLEAEAAVSGASKTVAALEAALRTDDEESEKAKKPAASKGGDKKEKSPDDDLLDSEWIRRWVLVAPALADEDLRPYLFVSRDRKALFTAGSNLALKEDWIEKLCGSTLGARAAAVEIAKLTPGEVEQIFDVVAARIRASTDLKKRPDGIEGLAELCKISPNLQTPTVRLLADLPSGQLGPWAATGWEKIFTSTEAKREFAKLKEGWAKLDENKPLQLAAGGRKRRGG